MNEKYCKYCRQLENKILTPCLQCQECQKLVHINCLRRKTTPGGIIGDVFFNFTCLECSRNNEEIFSRDKMPWFQAITLVLYDLSHKSEGTGRSGFFHWKIHISSYIDKHWQLLFRPDFKRKKNWIGTVSGTLSLYSPLFFTSGTNLLGEGGWWRLTYQNLSAEVIVQLCTEMTQIKQQQRAQNKNSDSNQLLTDSEIVTQLLRKYNYSALTENDSEDTKPVLPKRIKLESSHEDNFLNYELKFENDLLDIMPPMDNIFADYNFDFNFENFDVTSSDYNEESNSTVISYDVQDSDNASKSDASNSVEKLQLKTLFNVNTNNVNPLDSIIEHNSECDETIPLTTYEENEIYEKLSHSTTPLTQNLYRLRAKLRLRRLKRERNIQPFNIDIIYEHLSKNSDRFIDNNIQIKQERYLDRYSNVVLLAKSSMHQNDSLPFYVKLIGYNKLKPIVSPYTNRILKPYIRRDKESTVALKPPWLRLMCELQTKVGIQKPQVASIDYCYVRPEHIPVINALCEQYFWPGIDMTESLQYPDFSCVVLYKKIIIGFAFMIPDVSYNESYISFIFTRPYWRRAGIATFMLYHLIQTCMGKEVTLHVSATNPAVILYQKFGFKVEEFIQDFYEKYMISNRRECKHALFLRLAK